MSKLDERIAAAEEKLKALKARQARAETRQRARDTKQKRQEEVRRKFLVGAVVLELVERGEIEKSCLVKWMDSALTRDEDKRLFANYRNPPGDLAPVNLATTKKIPDRPAGNGETDYLTAR
jgi:hypothetical protein